MKMAALFRLHCAQVTFSGALNRTIWKNFPTAIHAHALKTTLVLAAQNQNRYFHFSKRLLGDVVPFNLADIGEGIAEVQITEWYVNVGDTVNEFDQICEVKSDKASVTITSRFSGVIKKLYYETDEEALVGKPLLDIEVESPQNTEAVIKEREPIASASTASETLPPRVTNHVDIESLKMATPAARETRKEGVLTTPAVRKIAKENQIDLATVPASGKDGRILKEDILLFIEERETQSKSDSSDVPTKPLSPQIVGDKVVPIKGLQKVMLKTMMSSLEVPHFGYCDEVQMDSLMQVRRDLKDECKQRGNKLSFMPFFIKAASMALLHYPMLNAWLVGMDMMYKSAHNIGVAMDTKDGLLVPNIKDVREKSVFNISEELNRLHELGRKGRLTTTDLNDTTFTLSNIGSIGGTYAHPVISPPQVAIGAFGKMQTVPRFNTHGDVIQANIFNVSWSADHRIIDGATMARFSNLWKSYLETPSKFLLDMK